MKSHVDDFVLDPSVAVVYDMEFYSEGIYCHPHLDDSLLEFLRRTIGIMNRVWIRYENSSPLGSVAKLLERINFGKMEMQFIGTITDDGVEYLLKIIGNEKVEQLLLTVGKTTLTNPVEDLLNLSSRVRALFIQQESADARGAFLFGLKDADWATIILDMFTRKVYVIKIHTCYHYLSKECANLLRQPLPFHNKKVYFYSSCNAFDDGFEDTSNGYTIIGLS
ncbi:hypothetical protein PENTCL1PPCAC_19509 [Pristionchus entomophagus]|uniref:NYN domain-containing protein n=1 Tax=Pristionchus entomophagus TaxID=358040 RepID=A0AAV5TSA6_9BILA|nr:hypothetical protein PENTCL1PPCAC_19509 [Pristionchus entomophagus]